MRAFGVLTGYLGAPTPVHHPLAPPPTLLVGEAFMRGGGAAAGQGEIGWGTDAAETLRNRIGFTRVLSHSS